MAKLKRYYDTPAKDKSVERHKLRAAKKMINHIPSDMESESESSESSSESSRSSSSSSSENIMSANSNRNIMPPAASSPSSNGQQVDLEEIMNADADDDNNISPAAACPLPSENTTVAAAPSVSSSENSSDSQSSEESDSSSEETSYICDFAKCGLVFDTAKELKDHARKHQVKRALDGCIHCDVASCKNHYGMK